MASSGKRERIENLMAFNPVDADVRNYLDGAGYPASGGELASVAQDNDAPDALVEELRNLGDETFSGLGEVRAAHVAQVGRRERTRLLRRPY